MKRVLRFLNPITHLGDRQYSFFFPLITTLCAIVIFEWITVGVLNNPDAAGAYIIFLFIVLIIYFSFREGVRGGFITTWLTILYYSYFIYTRNYEGDQLRSGIEAVIILGILYLLLAWIIGWLKQTIDTLIEAEANEKNRLRTILEQLPVGVAIADVNGKLILGNRQLERIFERNTRSQRQPIQHEMVEAFYNGKQIKPEQWPLSQTLTTGKPARGKEIILSRNKDKKRHIYVTASPIHNHKGQMIAAASIFDDITQQKEIEERKDDFINMASHELKTPLTSMLLYMEMLQDQIKKKGDKKTMQVLSRITGQTERLNKLVNDLLDVSRLQTGKLTLSPEVFNLTDLVERTVFEMQGGAKNRIIRYKAATAYTVYADKFRIYQVLSNLITNALKYSEETTPVSITVTRKKQTVIVSVIDQGVGIAKEQQAKVFDRLYQINGNSGKTFPGLGMGLYIVKEIIKRNKGAVWVESEVGKGSTFSFSLPIAKHVKPKEP